MPLPTERVSLIASFELNALCAAGVQGEDYEKLRIAKRGTPVHDLRG